MEGLHLITIPAITVDKLKYKNILKPLDKINYLCYTIYVRKTSNEFEWRFYL